jgi:hypothetical protein
MQSQILASPSPYILLNCSRQWGKTTVIAIKALHFALFHPRTSTLVAAPSERQSAILLRRLQAFLKSLDLTPAPVPGIPFSVRLPNASEITALPASADTILGILRDHLAHFAPASPVESHIVQPLAHTEWSIFRLQAVEAAFFDRIHQNHDPARWGEAPVDSPPTRLGIALVNSINASGIARYLSTLPPPAAPVRIGFEFLPEDGRNRHRPELSPASDEAS